jgi:hypothetical protein
VAELVLPSADDLARAAEGALDLPIDQPKGERFLLAASVWEDHVAIAWLESRGKHGNFLHTSLRLRAGGEIIGNGHLVGAPTPWARPAAGGIVATTNMTAASAGEGAPVVGMIAGLAAADAARVVAFPRGTDPLGGHASPVQRSGGFIAIGPGAQDGMHVEALTAGGVLL